MTERMIWIITVGILSILLVLDGGFRLKDKLAQARVDGANQVREQLKKQYDDSIAAREKQYQADKAADKAEIDAAHKSIKSMADYVNRKVPEAPKKIVVNTGQPYTVTLQTGDALLPAESAPAYFNAFAAGQTCRTDLKKCVGDYNDYKGKYTVTQQQYDDEKKVKKRSFWSVMGQAACSGGGAGIGALIGKAKGAAIGGTVAGGVCGFKF